MRRIHKITILLVLTFFIVAFNSIVFAAEENDSDRVQSLIVETKDVEEIKKDENVENITQVAEDIFIVDYADKDTAKEGLEQLESNENISNAFEDVEITLLSDEINFLSADPDYIAWGVSTTGMDHYTQFLKHKNCNTVKVGVLDTGINSKHEVFSENTVADRITFDYAYNYTVEETDSNYENKKNDVTDDQGHGTMVASVIAECTPSNVLIAPIKVLDSEGRGYINKTLVAIANIKDEIDIVNLSLGTLKGNINSEQLELYERTLKSIYDNGNGPIIICATGNNGLNEVSYPACSPYTIAVSAIDNSKNLAKFISKCPDCDWDEEDDWIISEDGTEVCPKCNKSRSGSNFGDEVDFSAPGKNLTLANYKFDTETKYCWGSGTSAATPFVSAAFALLKSEMPNKNQIELKNELIASVEDLGEEGWDKYFGYGCINFINSRFENPVIANITKTKVTDYCYSISASAVCDDTITKYAIVNNSSTNPTKIWKNISNHSKDVTVNFDVDSNGEYTVYFQDTEADEGFYAFTVTEIKDKNTNANTNTNTNTNVNTKTNTNTNSNTNANSNSNTNTNTNANINTNTNTNTTISVRSITLNKTSVTVTSGENVYLTATVLPTNATNKKVTWSSNNTSIAVVDQNGKVITKGTGTAIITAKAGDKLATCTITIRPEKIPSVKYRTHVQNVGWQNYVKDGAMSGTSGRSLRLEGINIYVDGNGISGGIEYATHVQNIGWQNFVSNGAMSGTSGKSLRLEAIKIRLTGDLANKYDVYYRVHCQNFGWLGWAKNGAESGSSGYGYRLEGIEIKLVKKGGSAPGSTANSFYKAPPTVNYRTHVQDVGWQDYVTNGAMSGTSGRSLRLEGINIFLSNLNTSGGIEYATHVQNIGWQNYVKDGVMSGTSGQSLRLEAIKIRLTGDMANKYDIYYRVHCQNFGWMGWAKNGAQSGSAGFGYRLEGIEIKLVNKGGAAPGSTANSFIQR